MEDAGSMAKYDFIVDPPVMNAAGSLGYAPDRRSGRDWDRFGAFVTNPISLTPRSPAQGDRFLPFAGGFLLHTGYPNPGFSAVLRRSAAIWRRSPIPVIVHLLAQDPSEVSRMVPRLEGNEGVMGVEIGLPPGIDSLSAGQFIDAALGEILVIARLPFELALELAPVAMEAGAAAISLSAPRGSMPGADGHLVEGRLYGPAVFPLMLQLVHQLSGLGLPIIAAGGVYRQEDIQQALDIGAAAVQLDAALWLETQ